MMMETYIGPRLLQHLI